MIEGIFNIQPNDITTIAIIFFTIIIGGFLIDRVLLARLKNIVKKTRTHIDDIVIAVFSTFTFKFYVAVAFCITGILLQITPEISKILTAILIVVVFVFITKAMFSSIDLLFNEYQKKFVSNDNQLSNLLPTFVSTTKALVFIFFLIFVLSNVGINVTALVAGLGIGGVVFAFAFQKIITDIFNTISIFFDKPFLVGDVISLGDILGSIERIGLKTTAVRSIDGERVIIPNEEIVGSVVNNLSDRPKRRVIINIPISYKVKEDKLQKVSEVVEEAVKDVGGVEFSFMRLREVSEHAIMYELAYYITGASYFEHMKVRQEIFIAVIEKLKKSKIELGYPVNFVKRDII